MVRRLALVALPPLVAVTAFAASLNLGSDTLGAGSASTPRCGTAAMGVLPNLSGSNVVGVSITGIPSGCGGGTLTVTVDNGSAHSSGSATVPAGGGTLTVTLAASVALAAGMSSDLVVTGP